MKNFVNDSIDLEEFDIAFSRLWWEKMKIHDRFKKDLKRIENLELDPRSERFCSPITAVFRKFEELEDEECTQQEVKDYVRDTLEEIQPYL